MDAQIVADLFRQAMWIGFLISMPMLVAGMAVGLVLGLLQAVTQIQEQSLVFVPKVAIMVLVFVLTLPWVLIQLIEYCQDLFQGIPSLLF